MKKMMLLVVTLLGGVIAGVAAGLVAGLLLPAEKRANFSRQLADKIGPVLEQMPDG